MTRGRIIIWTYYCDVCRDEDAEVTSGDSVGDGTYAFDQAAADRLVRSEGWTIRRDGTIVCPRCADRGAA